MSCEDGSPISDVIVTVGSYILGVSDSEGIMELKIDGSKKTVVYLRKIGYSDTIVKEDLYDNVEICLRSINYQLPEVKIKGKVVSFANQIKYNIQKTSEMMLDILDTVYYSYSYSINVPDSNWSITMEGVLKLPFESYNKRKTGTWVSKYCNIETKVDSLFWNSKVLDDIIGNRMGHYINFDPMRKGNFLRKRIESKVKISKSYDSPNQTFHLGPTNGQLITLCFNEDSILNKYEMLWKLIPDKNAKITMNPTLINSTHQKVEYKTDRPITFSCLYNRTSYTTKEYLNYSIEVEMELLENMKSYDKCIDQTIFIDINKGYFKKYGLQVKYN